MNLKPWLKYTKALIFIFLKVGQMNEAIGLFVLYSAIVFGTISLFGFDLCFKEKVKLFIGFEIFLTLLIIGVWYATD